MDCIWVLGYSILNKNQKQIKTSGALHSAQLPPSSNNNSSREDFEFRLECQRVALRIRMLKSSQTPTSQFIQKLLPFKSM